jgi:CheY-like chemotaxis protein
LLPRRPQAAACWCASSIAATSSRICVDAMARILIAEDEAALCAMCARGVTMDGHEVATARDGGEALDLLAREDGRFDLLLTDVHMPVMDGIALSLAAARDFPDLTILLMTGYADQRERAQGLDALIHDVIAKPFSLATLRGAVNEALMVKARG